MKYTIVSGALLCFGVALAVFADDEERGAATTLDAVLVTGEQPGPSLWKVSKQTPDGEHVLWILGSHGPLPKRMTWKSTAVEEVIAESQEYLTGGSVNADIGFFKGLALLPSLVGVRNNPDKKKLAEVVPPDLYVRWTALKDTYIGRDNEAEKWRPIFAAQELYSKAIDKSGLESRGRITPVVQKLAKKHKLKITTPTIEVEIDKPRAAIKEFKKSQLDDVECFAKTIERLETDLDVMRARANAWARGDVKALRAMTHVDQIGACIAAVMNSQLVQERGYQDMPERMAEAWVAAAERALANNKSTFAVLSIDEIFKPDGYVARLRAKGYLVDEP